MAATPHPAPHWESVYATKAADAVSWYRPHLERSLAFIERASSDRDASIIDVGGGASTLVDDLLRKAYQDLTVLDLSASAIRIARQRLGAQAAAVQWLVGDVTEIDLPPHAYDVWHDRAVFHFLGTAALRAAYARQVVRVVRPGGHVIVATFGPEGPTRCSGLDVVRYDPQTLLTALGGGLHLIDSAEELHTTPFKTTQQFVYGLFRVP